jgi:hypothetical protein
MYRFSTETLLYRLVRAVRKPELLPQVQPAYQKVTLAEETLLHFTDRRHHLHRLYTNSDRRDGFLH